MAFSKRCSFSVLAPSFTDLHHEQDIRKMGGLRWIMPVTFLTYAIGMMNLSGVPFFFSGGWTKEEILHSTAHWSVSPLPHYLMLAGVILTARST